ncbi:MAG TPA: hypothetical protein DCX07_12465, partial [Phycisphaerales bacterium]|nr:hypothetical protein [Phycisphaerales bacterium]
MAGGKSNSELFLEYALRMTKHRLRMVGMASAVLLVLAVATGMLLAIVVADHFVPGGLSAGARTALRWLFLLTTGALTAWTILYPLARRINDLYVARMIERAHPEFRNDLTASLQLAGDARVSGTL